MEKHRRYARIRIRSMGTKAELASALEQTTLDPRQKQAVFLVFGCGLTRVKAAQEVGRSLSWVNKAISRAYDKLG